MTKAIAQIKEILIEVSCNPQDYDLDKTAMEIYALSRADIREGQIDLADFGALDAAADQREQ